MSSAFHSCLDLVWILGVNSCSPLGQVQRAALFLGHRQLKAMPQSHLQTHSIKYLLTRYWDAQLRDRRVIQCCASSQK